MRNEKITPLYERLSRDDELQGCLLYTSEPDEPIIQQFRFRAFAGIFGRVFIVRNSVPVKICLLYTSRCV